MIIVIGIVTAAAMAATYVPKVIQSVDVMTANQENRY